MGNHKYMGNPSLIHDPIPIFALSILIFPLMQLPDFLFLFRIIRTLRKCKIIKIGKFLS